MRLVDILDRRVDRVRDRLTVRELLGNPPMSLRPGGDLDEDVDAALAAAGESLPDFDAMAQSALADEVQDEDEDAAADDLEAELEDEDRRVQSGDRD